LATRQSPGRSISSLLRTAVKSIKPPWTEKGSAPCDVAHYAKKLYLLSAHTRAPRMTTEESVCHLKHRVFPFIPDIFDQSLRPVGYISILQLPSPVEPLRGHRSCLTKRVYGQWTSCLVALAAAGYFCWPELTNIRSTCCTYAALPMYALACDKSRRSGRQVCAIQHYLPRH
jgi:hypothetical protein